MYFCEKIIIVAHANLQEYLPKFLHCHIIFIIIILFLLKQQNYHINYIVVDYEQTNYIVATKIKNI